MDRIVGIETEYGCLMSNEELRCNSEVWPAKVKNYLFNRASAGTIDLHYRLKRMIAFRLSKTMSIITPARPLVATKII